MIIVSGTCSLDQMTPQPRIYSAAVMRVTLVLSPAGLALRCIDTTLTESRRATFSKKSDQVQSVAIPASRVCVVAFVFLPSKPIFPCDCSAATRY